MCVWDHVCLGGKQGAAWAYAQQQPLLVCCTGSNCLHMYGVKSHFVHLDATYVC